MSIPERYDAKESEAFWLEVWDRDGVYKFNPKSTKELYSIDTPPPTLSGMMHAGHAFSYSQTDFIARFQRMNGKEVLYPFGTDDNGLATERLIEKLKNVKSVKIARSEFVALCLSTLEELRPSFVNDWKRLGISCDFGVFYSTIDDHSRKISQKSFLDLHKKGREYRKDSPTMWCPECQTAIAQVELEDALLKSSFVDLRFELEGGGELCIATTRPEMLPACVGVFVHPDDERFKNLVGKKVKVPLFNQLVVVRADARADPSKGTGVVMCCTFGDQTDIEWFKAHNLELKVAITKDGKMSELCGKYAGKKVKDARVEIIEDLKSAGFVKGVKSIEHAVNVHERCGVEVEILQSKQWFIKYLDLKEEFLSQGRKLRWYPEFMRSRLENWIKGLQWDWCISRQRHFGVPFPVWYCKKCDAVVLADEKMLPVDPLESSPPIKKCAKCGCSKFVPEKDVLDTWATSSLTPRIVQGLVPKSLQKKVYPFSLRPQAHDIISFWLFNTIVKSYLEDETLPWNETAISGWLLASNGEKMSKSKGNVLEPQKVIEKYSADALRYLAGSSKLGEDLHYQEKLVVTGEKLVKKLWNATKFVAPHMEQYDGERPERLELADAWALSKLQRTIEKATEHFLVYEYSHALREAESFFWKVWCDQYLELVKDRLYQPEKYSRDEVRSARFTLYHGTLAVLKLFAPFVPYCAEEAYHIVHAKRERAASIHTTTWPLVDKIFLNQSVEEAGDVLVDIINAVRKIKSQKQLSIKAPLAELRIHCEDRHGEVLKLIERDLKVITASKKVARSKDVSAPCERFAIEVGVTFEDGSVKR